MANNNESRTEEDIILEEVIRPKTSQAAARDDTDSRRLKHIKEVLVDDDKDDDLIDEAAVNLFNQVADELRKSGAAQVDYSAQSSNRIEVNVIEDAKHLLRLFGLPYVESPGEAEAQCAFVSSLFCVNLGLTHSLDTILLNKFTHRVPKVYKF